MTDKVVKVLVPIAGQETPGKISWSLEAGAVFKSDCGTHCIPVSREQWERLIPTTTPVVKLTILF